MLSESPRILEIHVSTGHDFKGRHGKSRLRNETKRLDEVECVAGKGLRGDRFFDYKSDFKGQVTFFDQAVADDPDSAMHGTASERTADRIQ